VFLSAFFVRRLCQLENENMLNGEVISAMLLNLVASPGPLTWEPEELNLKLLTGQASAIFWQFLSPAQWLAGV
jgi:aminopeptidase N